MNGNANLNANNLSKKNIEDWRKKLGLSSFKYDLLWSGNTAGTKNLSHSIKEYDVLSSMFKDSNAEWSTSFVLAKQVAYEVENQGNFAWNTNLNNRDVYRYQIFKFISNTKMSVALNGSQYNYLFGIKF